MLGGEAESPRYFLSFAARLGGRKETGAGRGGQECRRGQKLRSTRQIADCGVRDRSWRTRQIWVLTCERMNVMMLLVM